jgi:hypothetical protein
MPTGPGDLAGWVDVLRQDAFWTHDTGLSEITADVLKSSQGRVRAFIAQREKNRAAGSTFEMQGIIDQLLAFTTRAMICCHTDSTWPHPDIRKPQPIVDIKPYSTEVVEMEHVLLDETCQALNKLVSDLQRHLALLKDDNKNKVHFSLYLQLACSLCLGVLTIEMWH